MSYARFGWEGSDVYIYGSAEGPQWATADTPPEGKHWIECCACKLAAEYRKPESEEEKAAVADVNINGVSGLDIEWDYGPIQHFDTAAGILAHLEKHREAGHTVPESCIEQLQKDDWVPQD